MSKLHKSKLMIFGLALVTVVGLSFCVLRPPLRHHHLIFCELKMQLLQFVAGEDIVVLNAGSSNPLLKSDLYLEVVPVYTFLDGKNVNYHFVCIENCKDVPESDDGIHPAIDPNWDRAKE